MDELLKRILEDSVSLQVRCSVAMFAGLPKSDKTSFSHLLMKGRHRCASDARNYTLFIKKVCATTGKSTDWEETTTSILIDKINSFISLTKATKEKDMDIKEIWNLLILSEVNVMPCTAYSPYLFPQASLTFVVGKLADLHASFEEYIQCKNESLLPKFDNLHVFKNIISANCLKLKRRCEEDILFQDLVMEKSSRIYTAFIGTHENEVSADSVINVGLKCMVNDINLPNKHEPLPILHVESKLIHTVNVAEKSDQNANKLHDEMNDLLKKHTVYRIPIYWLLLMLELQQLCIAKDLKYIWFNDVFETLWKSKFNKHNKTELKCALKFFSRLGFGWYFEDSTYSCVFSNWKWLLQTIEKFMKMAIPELGTTYMLYNRSVYDGILTKKIISTISQSFKVETRLLINLLVHLKLAIPLNPCDSNIAKEESEYFIPHRLPSICNDEILSQYGELQLEPLMLTYSSGTAHPSLFCMFAGYLLQNYETLSDDWSHPQESDGTEQFTFSNLITFPVGSDYSVTLYDKIFWLEIQIRKRFREGTKHKDINCPTLSNITKVLRTAYNFFKREENDLACGFLCSLCKRHSHNHMMMVKPCRSNKWHAICCKKGRKETLTSDWYTVWFKQVSNLSFFVVVVIEQTHNY